MHYFASGTLDLIRGLQTSLSTRKQQHIHTRKISLSRHTCIQPGFLSHFPLHNCPSLTSQKKITLLFHPVLQPLLNCLSVEAPLSVLNKMTITNFGICTDEVNEPNNSTKSICKSHGF